MIGDIDISMHSFPTGSLGGGEYYESPEIQALINGLDGVGLDDCDMVDSVNDEEQIVISQTQVEEDAEVQKTEEGSYYDFVVDYVAYNSYDGGFSDGWLYHHVPMDEESMEDPKTVEETPVGNDYGHGSEEDYRNETLAVGEKHANRIAEGLGDSDSLFGLTSRHARHLPCQTSMHPE